MELEWIRPGINLCAYGAPDDRRSFKILVVSTNVTYIYDI